MLRHAVIWRRISGGTGPTVPIAAGL